MLMAFSTTLRLWLFFLVLSTTLWMDQLDGGLLHTFLTKGQFETYIATCSAALIVSNFSSMSQQRSNTIFE